MAIVMDHISGENRNIPLGLSLEELVGLESFARIVDAFVDARVAVDRWQSNYDRFLQDTGSKQLEEQLQ